MIIKNASEHTLPVAGTLLAPGETMETVEGQAVDRFVEAWIAGGALRIMSSAQADVEEVSAEESKEPSWRNRIFGAIEP